MKYTGKTAGFFENLKIGYKAHKHNPLAGEFEITSLFLNGEFYKNDHLLNVGFETTFNEYPVRIKRKFNASIISALTFAKIEEDDGVYGKNEEHYIAWEESLRLSYFLMDDLRVYSEAGIDFGELLFDGTNDDENVRMDYFFSVGFSYEIEPFCMGLYVKQRSIDGPFLDKINRFYLGVGTSIIF